MGCKAAALCSLRLINPDLLVLEVAGDCDPEFAPIIKTAKAFGFEIALCLCFAVPPRSNRLSKAQGAIPSFPIHCSLRLACPTWNRTGTKIKMGQGG